MSSDEISILDDISLATHSHESLPTIQQAKPSTSSLFLYSVLRHVIAVPFYNTYLLWQVHYTPTITGTDTASPTTSTPSPTPSATTPTTPTPNTSPPSTTTPTTDPLALDTKSSTSEDKEDSIQFIDSDGYIVKSNHMPLESSSLKTLSNLIYLPTEGLSSPWKGLSTALIKDFLGFTLEPFLTQRVHDLIPLDYDSCQYPSNKDLVPALIRTITTDCVFGVVFSPFDILRTRMIVQSSSHQTYKGPLRGLIKVTKEYTMKHLKLALMFASFKSITRHLKFILFDIFDGWQKVVFDLVWDIGEVALGCIVETVVRRGYLQGFEGQSVVPYQRARKVDTIKTDKRYLLRGLKMRVGMLLLHKVIGGLVVNLDIDEE